MTHLEPGAAVGTSPMTPVPPAAVPQQAPLTAPPMPPQAAAPADGLAIAGLVLAFIAAPVGLILSLVALVKRKKAGASIAMPLIGVIVSALFVIGTIIAIAVGVNMLAQVAQICQELGPGTWEAGGVTYTCG